MVPKPVQNFSNISQFYAQPTLIPRFMLQVMGSFYLIPTTSLELYGSISMPHATRFVDATSLSSAALVSEMSDVLVR